MAITRAARAGRRLELVAAFAEIETDLRRQLEALPLQPRVRTERAPAAAPVSAAA